MLGTASPDLNFCGAACVAEYRPRRDVGYHDEKGGKTDQVCCRRWRHGLRHPHVCICGLHFRLPDERKARRKMLAKRQGESRLRAALPPLVARVLNRPRRSPSGSSPGSGEEKGA